MQTPWGSFEFSCQLNDMKTNPLILTLLLSAFVLPASAQKGGHEKNHGAAGEKAGKPQGHKQSQSHHSSNPDRQSPQKQSQPTEHPQKEPQQKQARHEDQHPGHSEQQSHDWQKQRGWQKEGSWKEHDDWHGGRATHWQTEHRTWVQRGGYGGYYIPRNSFQIYFGEDHGFRIRTRPVIYMGYPRFEHGGYSFMIVDPWPEDWDETWYESDDVYIRYDGGYYLYDRNRPGVAIAVTVIQ